MEVFSVATRADRGFKAFKESLSRFGVDITWLGGGEPDYWGHGWKWKTFIRAVRTSAAEVVLFSDAYDVLCVDGLAAMQSGFEELRHPIVFSYEQQDQPEFWLQLNSGLVMAEREALLEFFHEGMLEEIFPNHFNDQLQIQSLYGLNPEAFRLDADGRLFHTICPRTPALVEREGRLVNPKTGQSPCFVHAPYRGDLSMVEQWLARQGIGTTTV